MFRCLLCCVAGCWWFVSVAWSCVGLCSLCLCVVFVCWLAGRGRSCVVCLFVSGGVGRLFGLPVVWWFFVVGFFLFGCCPVCLVLGGLFVWCRLVVLVLCFCCWLAGGCGWFWLSRLVRLDAFGPSNEVHC